MEWKIVNEDYLNYLRHNETRIPHSNYGEDKYKPFFGILFETNDFYNTNFTCKEQAWTDERKCGFP